MELRPVQEKCKEFIHKYRYAVLVLLVGIILMCLPGKEEATTQTETIQTNEEISVSQELADILSNIEGAGAVRVLLTVANGEETIYQTDQSMTDTDNGISTQSDTVLITDAQRNQTGLIRQINPPTYQGAIVVCQGADKPSVQLAIINAVSRITGLRTDRISVLKMK